MFLFVGNTDIIIYGNTDKMVAILKKNFHNKELKKQKSNAEEKKKKHTV
jgi:hypothetical protein